MIKISNKKETYIIDEKTYQSLNEKGFGTKITNEIFELTIYESLFLLEKNKARIYDINDKELTINEIFKKKTFNLTQYKVFKDLRTKGYNVKSGFKYGFAFRIYDKGIKPGLDHSLWLVEAVAEKDKIFFKDLAGSNRVAHSAGKKMLFAIVDEEGDVTYLENSWKRL